MADPRPDTGVFSYSAAGGAGRTGRIVTDSHAGAPSLSANERRRCLSSIASGVARVLGARGQSNRVPPKKRGRMGPESIKMLSNGVVA